MGGIMSSKKKELCDEVVKIDRLLNGNGEKGMLQKVDELYSFMDQLKGAKTMLTAILGTSLIGLLLAVYGLFK
jgi:hypothetical protein